MANLKKRWFFRKSGFSDEGCCTGRNCGYTGGRLVFGNVSGTWGDWKNAGVSAGELGQKRPVFGDNGKMPAEIRVKSTRPYYVYTPVFRRKF